MRTWFTSDTHFGHKSIVKSRPFGSVDEMDDAMVSRWNSVVGKCDVVWHLGDFSFFSPSEYVRRLNGKICLCVGNHDHRRLYQLRKCVQVIHEAVQIEMRGVKIWLSHYAHRTWPSRHYGSIHLYGHSHGKLSDPEKGSMDVGVDTHDFTPYSVDDVFRLLIPRDQCQKCHGSGRVKVSVLDAEAPFECPECEGRGSHRVVSK